ncbi:two-component system response regulator RppA [Geminocystis sp. GBBB08]|uniref:two-component system response regulator RppA n=1 Tax=Geminocystis sp. GBBB08 TaxID=2604140 RepID=UPI0027E3491B|nr:two-component system response regulator RppA [Geminocystis sp. GBBB08]MBL1210730.1 response regulator transcription factor [Geminocystis sp. GBBB08]
MRILLVEDESDLGLAIKKTLTQNNYIVDWVLDGKEASNYLDDHFIHYDLAIIDWLLPTLSGIEIIKFLRKKNNPLPVLMLTAKDSMIDKVTGLDAGADDYLIKPFDMIELLARIRALSRRLPLFQPSQLQVNNLILDSQDYTLKIQEKTGELIVISLTNKEFNLLECFMKHPQQIITRDQLLYQLWEVGAETISNVVAAQIRLLRKKLGQYGYDNLIETVYGLGYRLGIK